jgi:hypothetical protein
MGMRQKNVLSIIGIIIVIGGILAVKISLLSKENKAIELATEYLNSKYEREMRYESIRFSWIDPALYHVRFSLVENSDLIFEVLVQQDITIQDGVHENSSADNYYIKYFEYQMEDFLSDDIKRLWGNEADVQVLQMNNSLYSFLMPFELNDTMSLNEMKALLNNYWIYIETKETISDKRSINESAYLIYQFIQAIRNYEFAPKTISYKYFDADKKTNSIIFHSLHEIDTVTQVVELIEAGLGR